MLTLQAKVLADSVVLTGCMFTESTDVQVACCCPCQWIVGQPIEAQLTGSIASAADALSFAIFTEYCALELTTL